MKRLLKWLLVISVLGALLVVALRFISRRRNSEQPPVERWEPPASATPMQTVTVEQPAPAAEEQPAVEEAAPIIEGEFEPPEEGGAPQDIILDEEPAEELSEPLLDADRAEAEPELAQHLHQAALAAIDARYEPPEEGGPPEDIVLEEEPAEELSEPLLEADRAEAEPELAQHALEAEQAAREADAAAEVREARELADALLATPEPGPSLAPAPFEAAQETESGVVTPDEALALDRDQGMPVAAEIVAEEMQPPPGPPVEQAAPPEAADLAFEPRNAEAEANADLLVRQFEELAATPVEEPQRPVVEEPPAPTPPAAAAFADLSEEDAALAETLEEALTDVAPAPIVPPPRRGADAFLDEGNVYFNVGQYALAVDRYTRAIELDPQLIAGFYNRANARTRAGEFDEALGDYDRALELQPHDADALNNRGMLHLYRGNYAHALQDFDAALVEDPGDTTVMVNRGLAHLHGGDPDRALADFREAFAHDPSDAAAQYGAAQASATIGNRSDALRYIEAALKLDPSYAREAAGDPRLALLQGDETFLRLLREAGSRQ